MNPIMAGGREPYKSVVCYSQRETHTASKPDRGASRKGTAMLPTNASISVNLIAARVSKPKATKSR